MLQDFRFGFLWFSCIVGCWGVYVAMCFDCLGGLVGLGFLVVGCFCCGYWWLLCCAGLVVGIACSL